MSNMAPKPADAGKVQYNFTLDSAVPNPEPSDPGVGPQFRPGDFSAGDEGVALGSDDWNDPGSIDSGMSHEHPSFARSSGARY